MHLATSMPVKPNPAFDKKGTKTGRFAHGVDRDEAKSKAQYIKEQLEMRVHKFTSKHLTNKGKFIKYALQHG